jgi:hypothetical protein
LRLARPELGWLQQQADSRPQAREKKQVKLRAALWLANLPAQQTLRGSHSAQAKRRG